MGIAGSAAGASPFFYAPFGHETATVLHEPRQKCRIPGAKGIKGIKGIKALTHPN
jgi:hypothetical protein